MSNPGLNDSRPLIRKSNWPELLASFLSERETRPFEWGIQDCALFVCDAVLTMTGTDLAADFRGSYSTRLQAARALRSFGCYDIGQLADMIAVRYAIPEIGVTQAGRGDVILVQGGISRTLAVSGGPALGIVGMDGRNACFPSVSGLEAISSSLWTKAWRIG